MNPKWIEPETRLIINSLLRRNFDTFTEDAQQTANWTVLIGDVVAVVILLAWL